MRIALLTTCHLEYVAQLANALSPTDDVSIHVLSGLQFLVRENWRFPDQNLFRERYESYLASPVKLGTVNPWPYKFDPRGLIAGLDYVVRGIRRSRPDVIHLQEALDYRIFLTAMALRDIPLVITAHDPRVRYGDKMRLDSRLELHLRAILRHRANRIIVHGEILRKQILSDASLLPGRVISVPLGAYDMYLRWQDPRIVECEGTILFFGRIVPSKGVDVLIQAEPLVTARCPNVRFVIAGEGEDWKSYAKEIIHPERFVVHNRYIPNEQVSELFQRATLVVLPYRDCSQSAVAALACALGKPVVATRVGGLPEMVVDGVTGMIVPPGDATALADAIVQMLQNAQMRAEMGRNALARAEGDLSWQGVARRTHEVYAEVARACEP